MANNSTIFDKSQQGRIAGAHVSAFDELTNIPTQFRRDSSPLVPEVSELQAVRHFTNLSQKNYSIDSCFYPLGSCTMKYNPRGAHRAASLPGFLQRHPLTPDCASQGVLSSLYELQTILQTVTGMEAVSLAPMAGAQGELAGVLMIKAYHDSRKDFARNEIVIPTAAHGTNPATATMSGCKVREVQVDHDGDVDIEDLKRVVGPATAGIMLTNPSTCAVFERRIMEIADIVHDAGGLLYYDGANLNAIIGKVCPGDMGFDVLHLNLHKTFATPHGGGGPGAGPVAVNKTLLPYLPTPIVARSDNIYHWLEKEDLPHSIGRMSAFTGNTGILLRALAYARMLGRDGMVRVSEFATLNANYLMVELQKAGFQLAYPNRRATHEFIISLSHEAKQYGVKALDFAKRLLDYGVHAPTIYFPLLIPECFLIEPTETETLEELDAFVSAMQQIRTEAQENPELVRNAPHTLPVKRLDEVQAARLLDLTWSPQSSE
ncbi:MAG: aminomethyl-transferring glycine dehydrogenase subunit GcvPB [Gammaproteobacteria bacterium]|nr:aminomethyl-transferring glycine dehydrogenase subunit GcvPB [Gammaproteobacteria bacterium]MDE0252239.1 aminomethyl-transferring glycine dehydrogenase subunit GcvPB [Gammaproteobacteria bacterium]MDE0402652.1 aminomethyl-transferring glycine dehydrogenase subunit GcvPB [Gammaproteobacteria bacterium]MDE0646133.1 aminomethyl-transferring glycine dehydrogenase subunit GcvPB [Gammaproteobacteria bacterium]